MFGLFRKPEPKQHQLAPMDLFIATLGDVMEARSGPVEDVAALPADKQLFKQALIAKLSTVSGKAQRETLIGAYLMLSTFQPLTPAEKEVVRTYPEIFQKLPKTPPAEMTAEDKLAMSEFLRAHAVYGPLLERTFSERELLENELRAAGVTNALS